MPKLPQIQSIPNTLPSLTANPETTYAINRHSRQITYKGNVPILTAPVPAQDKSAMTSRLAECHKLMTALSPSERAPLALALSRMFAGFNDFRPMDVEMIVTTYIKALSSLPFWTLDRAIFDIERGRVEGLSPDFRPTTPRIYKLAEAKLEEIQTEKARIETILNARLDDVPSCDPEQVLHVAAKMKTFAADFAKRTEAHREKDDQKRREIAQRALERRYDEILAEYRAHGFKPICANGKPMCLSLALAIGAKLQPLGEPPKVQDEPN
jgi:hypothetical protein